MRVPPMLMTTNEPEVDCSVHQGPRRRSLEEGPRPSRRFRARLDFRLFQPVSGWPVRHLNASLLIHRMDQFRPKIHRSFRCEPVVVHARRSPGNGRRGAAGRGWFWNRGSGRRQSPPPFVVHVPAVHHLHQCHDSSGINEGHQPTARAAFTNGKPRIQKLLEPLDLQLITPEIKRRNRTAIWNAV